MSFPATIFVSIRKQTRKWVFFIVQLTEYFVLMYQPVKN